MSKTSYDADTMTVTVDDTEVQQGLGGLSAKTPNVVSFAINKTARQMRREEIAEADDRYALTERGREKLKHLKERKRASKRSLENVSRQDDFGHKFDAGYFEHKTEDVHTGWDAVMNSPEFYSVRVLKSGGFKNLVEESNRSKSFLAVMTNTKAGNEHTGMLRRKTDKYTGSFHTKKGHRRWRASYNGQKKGVEPLDTTAYPGASSMQRKVWDETVEEHTEQNLQENVTKRMEQVVRNAAKKR